jgi:hypothetical protein
MEDKQLTPKFRYIHTSIWDDDWFCQLKSDEKVIFIWLFSNSRSGISGIFQFSPFVCARETALSIDVVNKTIEEFANSGKLMIDGEYIWVKNLRKYNNARGELNNKAISNDLNKVTPKMLSAYKEYYSFQKPIEIDEETAPDEDSIDTHSIPLEGVSIPIADKDKDKDKDKGYILPAKKTAGKNNLYPLAVALSKVTGMSMEANRERIFAEAKLLARDPTVSPEKVIEDYQTGSLWYRLDWRGKNGDLPKLTQIRETWGTLKLMKQNNKQNVDAVKEKNKLEDEKAREMAGRLYGNL